MIIVILVNSVMANLLEKLTEMALTRKLIESIANFAV